MRPPPVSAKILWISGRGNCKEAIFALENGIFRRGVLRAHAPLNSAWSYHCARRLACGTPCFIGLTSRCFAHRARASCAPLEARGALIVDKPLVCQRGLPGRLQIKDLRPVAGTGMHFYVSHRPALRLRGVPALRTPFGRVLAPSALRAFTFLQAFALQKMPEMTCTPQFAMVVLLRLRACSTPLFIGLTTACFAHCARPSCAPAVHAAGDD